ncbi:BTAD domain-containing putative transcriptional regulator [Streptomyces sp. H27-H1]|uniref:AfsR/SARP family transcriptional regulator n=1 Tax=Streptomyces sp. H27-H1 TaxID=2996461 RepID=UPI002270C50F|nr:BTAD domain-containing putative transcriptional regulator [Streptomyces sp. H27-H1]MCY0928615.1 BTAD domain-containing putative transcriptional regulator [Streptomyces sp. H27-H1]
MNPTGLGIVHISLLPGFVCRTDHRVTDLSDIQQRIVAALVLNDRPFRRGDLAARLWPDAPADRAGARLRQTLWRLNQATAGGLLRASHTTVTLADDVEVDYRAAAGLMAAVSGAGGIVVAEDRLPQAWSVLRHPLLNDWDDDWLVPFQEKWKLQRVQTLERLAERFLQRRQHSAVLELADAATQADPLREGPRRLAVQSCLFVGEVADAHRRYRRYQELLSAELGVAPSGAIPQLLRQDRERQLALAAEF